MDQGSLSLTQKRSIFKIALELIKVDNQIHRNEIAILDRLQSRFRLSQDELDQTHYISLQEAVESVKLLSPALREEQLGLFGEIIRVDNDVDFSEKLLFSAIRLSLHPDSAAWAGILSAQIADAETSGNQMVYLEQEYTPAVHEVFDDEYDFLLISKALGDMGIQLFDLDHVKAELQYDLLQKTVGYIVPSGGTRRGEKLGAMLQGIDAKAFYKVVTSRYKLSPEQIGSRSFLLLKLRDSWVLDDDDVSRKTTDFFYMDISRDVKKRVLSFVSLFDAKVSQLSYEGYYKLLFDEFSVQSKLMSRISLDGKWEFHLSDLDDEMVRFESSPQARCFYLLLLQAGQGGIAQDVFEEAIRELEQVIGRPAGSWDPVAYEAELLHRGSESDRLIYNAMKLYGAVSTKDPQDAAFPKYILKIFRYRSSLKNYVNNGFGAVERLANKEQYCIAFQPDTRSYCLPLSPSLFVGLTGTALWKQLF